MLRIKGETDLEVVAPYIPDDRFNIEETAIKNYEIQQVYREIEKLPTKAQYNICEHYGLSGKNPRSISQIACETNQKEYEVKKGIQDNLFLIKIKMEMPTKPILLLKS